MVFRDGKVYSVSCVGDGQMLDLSHSTTDNGANIATWTYHGGDNQMWMATKALTGWRLSSLVQENPDPKAQKKCLEGSLKNGTVQHCIKRNGLNLSQQWFVQKLNYSKMGIVRIINVASNKCLTSHGFGINVTCEEEDAKNTKQHWQITQVAPATLNSPRASKLEINNNAVLEMTVIKEQKPVPVSRKIPPQKTTSSNRNNSLNINNTKNNNNNTNNEDKGEAETVIPKCTRCHLRPIDSVFYACGHMFMCFKCAVEFYRSKKDKACPICGAHISDVIQTYTVVG